MALKEVFDTLKREGKKALIPYITGGDPTKEKTIEIMDFFAKEGADIIELGVPFSDPMADGPVIQRAMERAIKSKTTLFDILEIVRKFKEQAKIPVVLMGYMNPFFSYGFERLIYEAKESGVDGILCIDLPYEEAYPFWMCAKRGGLDFVCLVSPLTNRSRITRIKRYASGFIYFVSVTGVTGERESLPEDVKGMLIDTKNLTKLPVVLGFGISKAETIEEFFDFTDGFVIGSALVRRLEEVSFDVESKGFKDFFYALERACHKKR